jgi:hypothetical protein
MPEVSRFYGIVIKIFYDDHNPPHFHADYGEYEVLVSINTLAIMGGRLPARAFGMVAEWASLSSAGTPCGMGEGEAAPAPCPDSTALVNVTGSRITRRRTNNTGAWISSRRTRPDPALVIRPRRGVSPELRCASRLDFAHATELLL